jgi:hypothetical protein
MSDRESARNFVTASPLGPAACAVNFVPCAAVPSLAVLCRMTVSVVVGGNVGRVIAHGSSPSSSRNRPCMNLVPFRFPSV